MTTSFGDEAAIVTAVALQPNGKIIVAGYSYTVQTGSAVENFALARFDRNGALDKSFGSGGKVTTQFGASAAAAAVSVEPRGKIVAAGSVFSDPEHRVRNFALVRYDTHGMLDPSFGQGGKVTTPFTGDAGIQGIAIARGEKIVAVGSSLSRSSGSSRFALARYEPDGSLDPSFGLKGTMTTAFGSGDDQAHANAIEPDGKIVVAGESDGATTNRSEFALARYLN